MTQNSYTVDFEPAGKRVEVKPGTTLLEAARLAGLPLTSECGGAGSCGQCQVIARETNSTLSAHSQVEQAILTDEELHAGLRLACQTDVLGDVKIDVPVYSLISGQRLQLDSTSSNGQTAFPGSFDDRVVQTYAVSVVPASLHDLRSDLGRVLDFLGSAYALSGLEAAPAAVRSLSPLLRQHNWQVSALLRGSQIVGFLAPGSHPLGLAVDLGTTKVAAYLVDLSSGETLAAEGRPNPQIGYGEDVISRLAYAINKDGGAQTLSRAVYKTLDELAGVLVERTGSSLSQIGEVCIVGNTAMTHLLLELPTHQLAQAPYVPATATPQEVRASDFGLAFAGDTRVHVPPCVAGYVGADLVAMTLASGIGQDQRTLLGIDIGTNTEIVLSVRGRPRLLALSCASGPAFEGAHIRAGMRAAAGAIEKIRLDGDRATYQTIDGALAVGICGSGIIDAVAELRRVGIINARGRFQADAPGVQMGHDGLEYVLVPASQSGTGENITIVQNDVNEIQFAKGAIMAGIRVLLQVGEVGLENLDGILLAGAFGTYLNLDTSIAMGLLPDIPLDRYQQIGNAAGDGARQILVSRAARARAVEIAGQIDYIELTVYPDFRRIYAKSMML
jgi:uncharacterized 2Fe-2S/4Fe-4S cluster protein (DUF4445 family)